MYVRYVVGCTLQKNWLQVLVLLFTCETLRASRASCFVGFVFL
jgi:hypothetical protein